MCGGYRMTNMDDGSTVLDGERDSKFIVSKYRINIKENTFQPQSISVDDAAFIDAASIAAC